MKRQIFIGDVQGCCEPVQRLLDKLKFDPAEDRLRFAGDLVNRGGESLEVLRLVRSLGDSAMTVLGNHDLHLLAWLISQPMFWKSDKRGLALVHAGTDPRWGPKKTAARAAEVEHALATEPARFFQHMYGDRPRRWRPSQPHYKRLRAITNVFARMRFCDANGRLEFNAKSNPRLVPKGFAPWFEHVHPDWRRHLLIFGHWSLLGLKLTEQVACLDTGCVWGNRLTALVDNGKTREIVSVRGRKVGGKDAG